MWPNQRQMNGIVVVLLSAVCQTAFAKAFGARSNEAAWEELGSPFEEDEEEEAVFALTLLKTS